MTMRPLQNQVNDVAVFGLSVALLGFITKMVREMTASAPGGAKAPALLPTTRTYTATQIFAAAKEYFSITTDPDEAGYILPDGTMLDFSDKNNGGDPGKRMLDHGDIAFAWPEDDSPGGFEAMKQVMNWGAVRFTTFRETVVVDLVKPLTEAQERAVDRALWYNPDAVLVIEVDNPELDQIDYWEFTHPFTNWKAFVEGTVAIGRLTVSTLLPQARRKDIDVLDRLIKEKHQDVNWEKWPHGTISDARKAVYKDILNGFGTVQEVKEYVEGMPEDSVIFTARGDEISFTLIKVITADIERNPWLSPFKPERRDISWQPPLMPETKKERAGRCYELAWRHIINHGEGTLIHGEVWSHKLGRMIGHAWVETETGFIYEPVSDQYFEKDWLYKTYKVKEFNTYTPEQAAIMAARTKTHGPWTEAERKAFLKPVEYLPASIPRDELTRIADKYGWWAAKLAESVCPHNDVACVEREARRLVEARRARLE